MKSISAAALLLALTTIPRAQATDLPQRNFGIWTNPSRSVQVLLHPCGNAVCGTVTWATAKAQADARRGGTSNLIGATLFQEFVQEKKGVWRGKVFVPDIRRTFRGTITMADTRTLKAQGCVLGGLFCKSQLWTRVDEPAG